MKHPNLVKNIHVLDGKYPFLLRVKSDVSLKQVVVLSKFLPTPLDVSINSFTPINAYVQVWSHIDDILHIKVRYKAKGKVYLETKTIDFSSSIDREFYYLINRVSYESKKYLK